MGYTDSCEGFSLQEEIQCLYRPVSERKDPLAESNIDNGNIVVFNVIRLLTNVVRSLAFNVMKLWVAIRLMVKRGRQRISVYYHYKAFSLPLTDRSIGESHKCPSQSLIISPWRRVS